MVKKLKLNKTNRKLVDFTSLIIVVFKDNQELCLVIEKEAASE
jgi:hypothetical protein